MDRSEAPGDSFVSKLAALINRHSKDCPVCEQHAERLFELDGTVYAYPCNCKLYEGHLPAKWWNTAHSTDY